MQESNCEYKCLSWEIKIIIIGVVTLCKLEIY